MKKSEQIRAQMRAEENDLKALGLGGKVIREQRSENFEENWLPKLREIYDVDYSPTIGSYTFELPRHGIIDFYPKANKLLIRKRNKWIKPGLKWIAAQIDKIKNKTLEVPAVRVKITPTDTDEVFYGTVIDEQQHFYVVITDDEPGQVQNWSKKVCTVIR